VYGAGAGNTKTSWANGWNTVNGHLPVGQIGGEEQHILTITEMPSHSHTFNFTDPLRGLISGVPDPGDWRGGEYGGVTGWQIHNASNSLPVLTYTGGNQPHNILPRFITLAYIMKL
jgi:microcystin-dependent protein